MSSPTPEAGEPGAGRPERLPVPLRPFTVPDVLDGGIAAIKLAPLQLLAVTAPFVVPVEALLAIVRAVQGGDASFGNSFSAAGQGAFSAAFTPALAGVAVASSVALTFAGAATARLVCAWYLGRSESPGQVLRAVVRRAPALVALWLLVHLLEACSAIPLVFTFVFLVPYFIASAAIVGVEAIGPGAAVRRCFALTRRRYGFVFGVMVMVAVLDAIISGVTTAVAVLAQEAVSATAGALDLGTSWVWVVGAAFSAGAALLVVPFVATTATLVYLDLRVRNEGLDIELAVIDQFGAP